MSQSKKVFELLLISVISLFFELLVIRWLSSEIRIFAYFKNMPLMASLFGLGLGLALAKSKRDLAWLFPAGLVVLSGIISFAEPLHLVHLVFINPAEHYLIGTVTTSFQGSATLLDKAMLVIPGLFILAGVFYLIVFTFMGIGQRLGKAFDEFPPLIAYSINVGASFLGIALFTGLSYLGFEPKIWLLCGVAMSLFFYHTRLQASLLVASLVLAFVGATPGVIWSPYYRISVSDAVVSPDGNHPAFPYGKLVRVNHDYIEGAFDNRPQTIAGASPAQLEQMTTFYNDLYDIIGSKPRSVLVLAAGTGNDLAAAIRNGATEVEGVEIDPTIVRLGHELHPEKPYDNPIVHVTVDDARAFFKRCKKKYDLVEFSWLDSHSAFSSMSSIRLDNYVYTVESFRDAAKLLKPDGILSVTFWSTTAWQQARLFKTITEAFGEEPIGVYSTKGLHALTFLIGPGLDRKRIIASGIKLLDKESVKKSLAYEMADWNRITPTTDDWPFLFLRYREMTFTYAAGLIFTLCLGWRLVRRCFGSYTVSPTGRTMFFLGAAFMLIEVKSVSQMGLLAGTTWIVNSAVIGVILLMILLANLCQLRFNLQNLKVLYGFLFASLLLSYLTPLSIFNSLPLAERLISGAAVLSLPILFASWIFAVTFSRVDVPHNALGMNLLGTLVGGALEYLSMIFGIAALNLVALGLYGLAFYFWQQMPKEVPAEATVG
jgi:spermidine synthase